MSVNIRPYENKDYNMICSWWEGHRETPPLPGMMVEDGTFVVEFNNEPVMTLTVLITQSSQVSYFEGYCAKPHLPKDISNELGVILWDHCYQWLKDNGYKRVNVLTDKHTLVNRYKDLGMSENMNGLYSLGRSLCLG